MNAQQGHMQSLECIKAQQYMETQDTLVGKGRYWAVEKAQTHTGHTKSSVSGASNNWELSGLHCNSDCTFPLIRAMKSVTFMTCWKNCKCHFCNHFYYWQQNYLQREIGLPWIQKGKNLFEQNSKKRQKALFIS